MSRRAARASGGAGGGGAGRGVIDLDRLAPRLPQIYTCQGLLPGAGLSSSCSSCSPPPPTPPPSPPQRARHKRTSNDSGVSGESYARGRRSRSRQLPDSAEDARDAAIVQFHAQYSSALREQRAQLARVARLCEQLSRHAVERRGKEESDNDRALQNTVEENNRVRKPVNSDYKQHRQPILVQRCEEQTSLLGRSLAPTESPVEINQQKIPRLNINSRESMRAERRTERRTLGELSPSQTTASSCTDADRRTPSLCPPDASAACRQVTARLEELVRGWLHSAAAQQPRHSRDSQPRVERGVSARRLGGGGASRLSAAPEDSHPYPLHDPVKLYEQSKRLQERTPRRARSADCTRLTPSSHPSPACSCQRAELGERTERTGRNVCVEQTGRNACAERTERTERTRDRGERGGKQVSLCALCRLYWRAIRKRMLDAVDGLEEDK